MLWWNVYLYSLYVSGAEIIISFFFSTSIRVLFYITFVYILSKKKEDKQDINFPSYLFFPPLDEASDG